MADVPKQPGQVSPEQRASEKIQDQTIRIEARASEVLHTHTEKSDRKRH